MAVLLGPYSRKYSNLDALLVFYSSGPATGSPPFSICTTSIAVISIERPVGGLPNVGKAKEADLCADSGATACRAVHGQRSVEGRDPVLHAAEPASGDGRAPPTPSSSIVTTSWPSASPGSRRAPCARSRTWPRLSAPRRR